MKFVAAKCPACGANIDVDKTSESTVCEFCNTRIIVEEAVEKHRVEIDNLPKAENFFTLGNRAYKNKDYDEAYDYYTKGLELSPNNELAIFRRGLSKVFKQSYPDINIRPAINSFNNVIEMLRKKKASSKRINEFISEMNFFLATIELDAMNYYKPGVLSYNALETYIDFLYNILTKLETLLDMVEDDDKLRSDILYYIITLIDHLIERKVYFGNNNYSLSSAAILELREKRNTYITIQNDINGIVVEEPKVVQVKSGTHKDPITLFIDKHPALKFCANGISWIVIAFYIIIILAGFSTGLILTPIYDICLIILMCPLVKLPEKYEIFKSWFIIIFMILASFIFLGLELSGTEENNINGSFVSVNNSNKFIKFDSVHYTVTEYGKDTVYNIYKINENEFDGYTEIDYDMLNVLFRYYPNNEVCICEYDTNRTCIDNFVPVEPEDGYTYLTECKK